ncbi:lipopolysaccharide assembly protein LapB [uncultured Enorma sp.]|uniref:tetratricopeptide repeat protein n=1 Tax=uncultured Enorma sp. TaxID=1714346 RepID=UPI0025993EB3|nr:hypothetical protein [uncultured Enorma sp.]
MRGDAEHQDTERADAPASGAQAPREVIDGAPAASELPESPADGDPLDLTPRPLPHAIRPLEPFSELPFVDAIDAVLLSCEARADASGIERFMHRVLSELDTARLRALAASRRLSLAFIDRMDAFYLNFDQSDVTSAERALIYAAETALNRIYRVLRLPGFGFAEVDASPSEEACSAYDQAMYAGATAVMGELMEQVSADNPWAALGTVACAPGGVWDVVTRFATLGEQIGMLARLDYRVRIAADCSELRIEFVAPGAASMPRSVYDLSAGAWRACLEAERAAWAREYTARMALVLATAGFAAGFAVERCSVTANDGAGGQPYAVALDRGWFMARLSAMRRDIDGCPLADALALDTLAACEVEPEEQGAEADMAERSEPHPAEPEAAEKAPDAPTADAASVEFRAPAHDARPLPPELRELLLADTAAELEVMEDDADPYMARLRGLREREEADPGFAERGYLEVVDELEAQCATRELLADAPVITRFCESYVGRIELPVFEEDASVRILRAPDALFFARLALCRMYLAAEAYERALAEARSLLDLAPTSMQAHVMLVNALARLDRYAEVVEAARHGLRVAFERDAISYLLYRVAFAFWRLGDRETAAACYRLVRGGGRGDALAEEELGELLREMGREDAPGVDESIARVRAQGLVCAPWSDGFKLVVDAAVLLADHGFFFLAGRCAHAMWHVLGRDELGVVSRALLG